MAESRCVFAISRYRVLVVKHWQRARKQASTQTAEAFSKEGEIVQWGVLNRSLPGQRSSASRCIENGPNGVKAVGSRRTRRALSVDKVWYRGGAQASGLFLSRGWCRRRAAGRVRRTSGVDDRVVSVMWLPVSRQRRVSALMMRSGDDMFDEAGAAFLFYLACFLARHGRTLGVCRGLAKPGVDSLLVRECGVGCAAGALIRCRGGCHYIASRAQGSQTRCESLREVRFTLLLT